VKPSAILVIWVLSRWKKLLAVATDGSEESQNTRYGDSTLLTESCWPVRQIGFGPLILGMGILVVADLMSTK
jgi:hypothetical protein